MSFRKTKIVCTLGPACDGHLDKMVAAGMDVARFNMSHGTLEDHSYRLKELHAAAQKHGKHVAVMADIQGPKIRIGTFPNGVMELVEGERVLLVPGNGSGGETAEGKTVKIGYKKLLETVAEHRIVYFADGLIEVKVEHVEKDHAVARVLTGGFLGDRKGVSIPNARIDLPCFGEKDWTAVEWAAKNDADYVAQSFVRSAKDVTKLRKLISYFDKDSKTRIIAKIEDASAIENLDQIISEADGVMVARGDLGVQIPFEQVPAVQKNIIAKCNCEGKPVITATQMLESMTANPVPTRAEVSDVANAILDGSDAVMLSGETAMGKYPLRVVEAMHKIALNAEQKLFKYYKEKHCATCKSAKIPCAVADAVCRMTEHLKAAAIVAFTETGSTPFLISARRPFTQIIAATPHEKTARWVALCWGTKALKVGHASNADEAAQLATKALLEQKIISKGDIIVVVAGTPFGTPGNTNFTKAVRA